MKSVLSFLLLFILNLPVYSQVNPTTSQSKEKAVLPNDLHELEVERLELISNMYGMMYEINSLFTELERSVSLERILESYEEINAADGETSVLSADHQQHLKRLEDIRTQIILPELHTTAGVSLSDVESMSVSEGFRRIIENKVQEVLKKTDQLSGVGAKVTELNNTSYVGQNFKKQISWSFAFLVGIVIVGFFIIANRDDQIRKSIFTGDAGLQFITIFSIIIAIILFGITEVLGGKEISALLGGISGYILGRSSLSKPFKTKEVPKA